ncbi:MAG: Ig-like domain-containing protein [Longimicrobiales bacterium]|nr:Ig-like domain-containing protein [Longimicrobiales bacterium]
MSIQPAQPQVQWGKKVALRATGNFSDGTIRPVEVRWEAPDPNRASVDSTGFVLGNQAGTAPIVAHFASWIADTVWVSVLPWERPDVALRSDFQDGDLERWEQFSSPPARTVELEGETVLSLEGDGRYSDVLVSKETFSLEEGARVEIEFLLPLTQTDRQRLLLCIQPAGNGEPPSEFQIPGIASGLAFCLRYPAQELAKFDPSKALVFYDRLAFREYLGLPEGTNSSEWTQLAFEIQPDGQVAISVNQELSEDLKSRIIIEPGTRWRIQLGGAAENTHLYVRNVTVYSGSGEG